MLTFHTQIAATAGAPVIIDCPACGAHGVQAIPLESVDWVKLAYVIPISKIRSTWVECIQCHAQIRCTVPLDQVSGADPRVLAPFLRYHPTGAAKAMSIIGLLTCLIPILGLVVVGIASFMARGTKGWPAMLNVLSLIVSMAVTVSVAFLIFASK
jgi:hypothetical protein